ncbi:MAG: Mu transposase C-terminal domain-containing protein [Sulfurimonas sp.]|jgi:putative transposase
MTRNENKIVKLDRSRLAIKQNDYVEFDKEIYKVSQLIDFDEIIGINIKDNRAKRLMIKNTKPISPESVIDNGHLSRDLSDISDEDYKEIEKRYLAIQPILSGNLSREEIEKHAKEIDVHYTTLYRWLRKYKSTGTLIGLLSKDSGRTKGEIRLDFNTEIIIQKVIENYFLTKQRPSAQAVINKINIECKNQSITPPSKNTIRNRIHKITEYERLKKQGNRSLARTKYEAAPGTYQSDYPLQVIQIDHTPVDIILVDDQDRKPIGRPWITLAIDIYSRMIVGYYLSLNAPSVTSVAMCITNAVLPKDELLFKFDINTNWDVWGFPDTIHADNGADFRADALKKACQINGINLEFRPIGKSNFGGHIERVIGTIMKEIHSIPGTTFSNIKERQTYDSDGNACMTFSELEKWIVTFITKIYHKRVHSGLGMAPEKKWEEGIFGSVNQEGVGYPPKPTDSLTITIDFLPMFTRTIQKNGVNIDGLNYYDNVLRSKINLIDEENNKKKIYIFKRDPRDISYIWYYDDVMLEYYKINLADQSIPSMSLWEFEATKNLIKQKGYATINNHIIIEAHEELHRQINDSVKKTKKTRREQQKIKNKNIENSVQENATTKNTDININENDGLWDDDIPEFN